MPATLSFDLRTIRAWTPSTRQLHGLACNLLEGEGADHTAQTKTFTVQPPTPAHEPSTRLHLRASWYGTTPVPEHALTTRLVRLGNTRCQVTHTDLHSVSFAELATAPPAAEATLTFHTPTYFTRSGEPDLTADPKLILGGYRRRWNTGVGTASPLAIREDAWAELQPCLRVKHVHLTTTHRDSGYEYDRAGFTGNVTLALTRTATSPTRQLFAALIHFAPYAGTGAATTHGFGATTSRVPGDSAKRSRGQAARPASGHQGARQRRRDMVGGGSR
ncbi:CRISPR system precrRNA processing endoribonuclease RAMP protein Cas6 [Streptomyces sp. NPDC003393]